MYAIRSYYARSNAKFTRRFKHVEAGMKKADMPMDAALDRPQRSLTFVITSYSIHYTKLYDLLRSAFDDVHRNALPLGGGLIDGLSHARDEHFVYRASGDDPRHENGDMGFFGFCFFSRFSRA